MAPYPRHEPVELLTMPRIARELGVAVHRVKYVVSTREHIRPIAKWNSVHFYPHDAIAMVRHELNAIDAHRAESRKPRRRAQNRETLWTT